MLQGRGLGSVKVRRSAVAARAFVALMLLVPVLAAGAVGSTAAPDGGEGASGEAVVLADVSYTDVPLSHLFHAEIRWLGNRGVTVGFEDGSFGPSLPVTRGAMALFLFRLQHPGEVPPACSEAPFTDVAASSSLCGAVVWLADEGITVGFADGSFGPSLPVTRGAMALFLFRLSNPGAPIPACAQAPFTDVAATSSLCGAIAWLVDTGVTLGFADGSFGSTLPVTRAAMAAFLHRLTTVVGATRVDANAVAAASRQSCAVSDMLETWCWGMVDHPDEQSATAIPSSSATRAVTGSGPHFCRLLADGTVECWGWVSFMNVPSHLAYEPTPTRIPGIASAVAVAAGQTSSCALLADERVACWGMSPLQQSTGAASTEVYPPAIIDLDPVRSIAVGERHSCAALVSGGVSCWGANGSDQLGDGSLVGSAVPVEVAGIDDAVAVAAGAAHSCAVLLSGGVSCWGANDAGQLGSLAGAALPDPTDVLELGDEMAGAASVASGGSHTCMALYSGEVACTGYNGSGVLGDGTTTSRAILAPAGVLDDAAMAAAGVRSSCAVRGDASVWCWGSYGDGKVTWFETVTTPTAVAGVTGATHLAIGRMAEPSSSLLPSLDRICAVVTDGAVECWIDLLWDRFTGEPEAVPGVMGASRVAVGDSFVCVMLSTGGVSCWGRNSVGQLGDGTTTNSSAPVDVLGITDASDITSGWEHTCVVASAGSVWCWGANDRGQLGDGTIIDASIPVEVVGIDAAVAVEAGAWHTCALLSDGSIRCWGANSHGQLGVGDFEDQLTSAPILGLAGAVDLGAGFQHTCAVLSGGGASCWGRNTSGELGVGETSFSAVPIDVIGIT